MAGTFNYTSKLGRVQIDDSQNVPFTPTPSLQNNTFLYGNRRPLKSPETSLPIPVPANGYPSYSYYQTYALPQNLITDPDALLSYFSACGYQVNYGYSDTTTLNNIGAYSPVPVASGQVVLYFSGQALNLSSVANSPLSGTFSVSGTAITGDIVSVSTGSYTQPILANFTGDTNTSTSLTNLDISTTLLEVGSLITGAGIPAGTTIASIVSSSSVTLSQAATATATGVSLSYTGATPLSADTQIVLNSTSYTGLQIGKNLTLDFIQQTSTPDVNNTEPFIMNLWQSATAMQQLTALNSNATTGAPAIYFAILPDFASTNYFQPTGTPLALAAAPATVATSGAYTTLSIPLTASYLSLVPSMMLGNTTITQTTSLAEGVVFQSRINGNMLEVQLTSVTGTFNTTNLLTLSLDDTITIMSLQQSYFNSRQLSLRTVPLIYAVNTNTDITSTYSALFNYVGGDNSGLNAPIQANVGQGNCSIVFGNQSISQLLATTQLPTAINNQYYEPVYYPFVRRPGVPNQTVGQTMCAMATVFASNIYPFNPLNDIELNGFTNSPYPQDWISMSIGGAADTIINNGWNVIATNPQGIQYLFLGRSGQTTINNVPDVEFYPSYVLDTKDYYKKALILICRNNGVGQVRQTNTTLSAIDLDIVGLNTQMSDDGILANVSTNNNLVRVTRSQQNPLGISIYAPIQQNPGLLYTYGTIINYSIEFTLS